MARGVQRKAGGKGAQVAAAPARRRRPGEAAAPPEPAPAKPSRAAPENVSLDQEVKAFSPPDPIALGDLEIRKNFADRVMILFAIANVGVLLGLGVIFAFDHIQLAAGLTKPSDRIVDGKVIMALLGATTVQLGTVIYTITRAIFPAHDAGK